MLRKIFLVLCILLLESFFSCNDEISPPENLVDIQLSYVSGSIGANLMPIIPPDPIACQIVLVATSTNQTKPLSGLSITQADVYLNSTNEKLGSIAFTTNWYGQLTPTESDTVRLNKITSPFSIFTPPCGKYVYLNLFVRQNLFTLTSFKTDSLYFGCVY